MKQFAKRLALGIAITTTITAPAIADKDLFDISGYVMGDIDSYDEVYLENDDSSYLEAYIRRARLSVKSNYYENWKTKLQLDIADGATIKDAYIAYEGLNAFDITLGKQKEAFGLEKLTSSKNLVFIERSMMSQAFAPGRSVGINLEGSPNQFEWSLGYFKDEDNSALNAVTGRLAWHPIQSKNSLLHFGVAMSERELGGEAFRINEKFELFSSDSLLEGDWFNADTASLGGMEFIGQYKGLTATAEWQNMAVTATDGTDHDYDGGYMQLSYALAGRGQRYKNGVLKGPKKQGVWQIGLRVSELELVDEQQKAQSLTFGVNYLATENIKFMADMIAAKNQEEGEWSDIGKGFALRAQFSF